MAKLFRDFYDRDTCTVARELVGKYLVRRLDGQLPVSYTHLDVYKRQVVVHSINLSMNSC